MLHAVLSPTELERNALERRGTENQRARYAEGLLPEDELLAIARAELFAPLNDFGPFRKLKPQECKHKSRLCRGHIEFETREAGELAHDEYEGLAKIRVAAELASRHEWINSSLVNESMRTNVSLHDMRRITVTPMTHWGTCKECGHETTRSSAMVTILWAGRLLSREYRLL